MSGTKILTVEIEVVEHSAQGGDRVDLRVHHELDRHAGGLDRLQPHTEVPSRSVWPPLGGVGATDPANARFVAATRSSWPPVDEAPKTISSALRPPS